MAMSFRVILIAGLLVSTSFFISQGFGDTYGVLQQAEEFEDRYPSRGSCDWNQTGVLVNLFANDQCELNIDDLTSTHTDLDLDRVPLVETQEEFEDLAFATNRLQYMNDTTYGDYITPNGNSVQFEYYTKDFYSKAAPLNVRYQYQNLSSPTSASLILWDVASANQEDSVTLTPGEQVDDYYVEKTLTPSNNGLYELRIEIDGATEDEQRIYSLYAWQDSEDLSGVSSGEYESDILYSSDDTTISRIEFLADDIQNDLQQQKQTAKVTFEGYQAGEIVQEKTFDASNTLEVRNNVLGHNETIEEVRFDIQLVSETGDTPEFSSMTVEGATADRVASEEVSDLLTVVFVVVLIGLGVLLVGSELTG